MGTSHGGILISVLSHEKPPVHNHSLSPAFSDFVMMCLIVNLDSAQGLLCV